MYQVLLQENVPHQFQFSRFYTKENTHTHKHTPEQRSTCVWHNNFFSLFFCAARVFGSRCCCYCGATSACSVYVDAFSLSRALVKINIFHFLSQLPFHMQNVKRTHTRTTQAHTDSATHNYRRAHRARFVMVRRKFSFSFSDDDIDSAAAAGKLAWTKHTIHHAACVAQM